MAWDYNREESNSYETRIPEGAHRIRIKAAEKSVSKTGNDMLVLQFDVSGYKDIIYHYIVFLQDKPQITNRNLTQFFDAFKDIPDGEFNMDKWIGATGACIIKHEEYNGNVNAKVDKFLPVEKQADLPAWRNADGTPAPVPDADGFVNMDNVESDLPF